MAAQPSPALAASVTAETAGVITIGSIAPDRSVRLEGDNVLLVPLAEHDERQLRQLYVAASFSDDQWTYTPSGPFPTYESFITDYVTKLAETRDKGETVSVVVCDKHRALRPVGMATFMAVDVRHRRLEIGNIWYRKDMWRSYANTETCYLMMKYAFDELKYRRVEWKCHHENARSAEAARKLGFTFEGAFRQHMIIKGRNRDSLYFSITDGEWQSRVKMHIEQRLAAHAQPCEAASTMPTTQQPVRPPQPALRSRL